jgi:hypothetical protein
MFSIAVMASACDRTTEVCAGVGVVGINLHVVSNATGASLDEQAVVKVVSLQAPFDSVVGPLLGNGSQGNPLYLTLDRPGRFDVTVDVAGFQRYRQVVTVEKDPAECGSVKVTRVVAELIPG